MDVPEIGRLGWQPALERLDLLASPVAAAVRELALDCFVAEIDESLADTAAFCTAYEVPLEVSPNCVVVAGRRAELSTTAAVLVLAVDRADVNRIVRQHLGVRKISFAPMAEATSATGMAYGGITPIGLPPEWPLLVDDQVAAKPWVVVGSGVRGSKIALRGANAAALPGAQVLPLRLT